MVRPRRFRSVSAVVAISLVCVMVPASLLVGGCPFSPGSQDNTGINDDGTTDGGGTDGSASTGGGVDGAAAIPARPTDFTVEAIVSVGDDVPGQDGATFTEFGTPIIDQGGRVAFWAKYTGGDGQDGLYVWEDGTLTKVIDDDPDNTGSVPDRDASAYFEGLNPNSPYNSQGDDELPLSWGTDGRLIFVSWIGGDDNSMGIFRWRASDGDIVKVVDVEEQAGVYDDTTAETFSCQFFQPVVSDNGLVSYVTQYTYITNTSGLVVSQRGVFTTNGVDIVRYVDTNPEGDLDVPDQTSTAIFTAVGELVSVNASGSVLCQAAYNVSGTNGRGVYVRSGGDLFRVIDSRENGGFDGLRLGDTVNASNATYQGIAIGSNLRIAIDTTITNSRDETHDVVLYYDGFDWTELQGDGDDATSLLTGVNGKGHVIFLVAGEPYLSAGGRSLRLLSGAPISLREVPWSASGGSVNNNGRAMLAYAGSTDNDPGIAFWNGEELVNVANFDAIVTPTGVELDRPGRSGALSDTDQMTFKATDYGNDEQPNTADDDISIYVATPE